MLSQPSCIHHRHGKFATSENIQSTEKRSATSCVRNHHINSHTYIIFWTAVVSFLGTQTNEKHMAITFKACDE